jgi:beta-galactosidase
MGSFRYRIPTSNGSHTVVLTFVDPQLRPGSRVFDVFANGQQVLRNLDVAASAGGMLTAYQRQFEVSIHDGILLLEFTPTKGDALVSAIEVK